MNHLDDDNRCRSRRLHRRGLQRDGLGSVCSGCRTDRSSERGGAHGGERSRDRHPTGDPAGCPRGDAAHGAIAVRRVVAGHQPSPPGPQSSPSHGRGVGLAAGAGAGVAVPGVGDERAEGPWVGGAGSTTTIRSCAAGAGVGFGKRVSARRSGGGSCAATALGWATSRTSKGPTRLAAARPVTPPVNPTRMTVTAKWGR